jgi:hypothetical protein
MKVMTIPTSVLIIAFRRSENLKEILGICVQKNVDTIYVNLDGPRGFEDKRDVDKCKLVLSNFESGFNGKLHIRTSSVNKGSAVSVLESCDWIFQNEEFAIILEDDCIPGSDFFDFVEDSKAILYSRDDVFSISGTQFAPPSVTKGQWALSRYPLFWGWATSKSKWKVARHHLSGMEINDDKRFFINYSEYCFWKSGAIRSLDGFVDAWDLPLLYSLVIDQKLQIQPGENLVKNIGVDLVATHTIKPSQWIGRECGRYTRSRFNPTKNANLDLWLFEQFYKIKKRHVLSTRLTLTFDILGINKRVRSPLKNRWS